MLQLKFVIGNWVLFITKMFEDRQDGLASKNSDIKPDKLSLTPETHVMGEKCTLRHVVL